MVYIDTEPVLLCKSNTHLDWPGALYLEAMIDLLVKDVQPRLILSIGTAGGAKPQDHIGTVRAVSAGKLYKTGQPSSNWPEYKNIWTGNNTLLDHAKFKQLLFAVPTKTSDLETLCTQFNQHYGTTYTLSQLDPSELNHGDPTPQIDNQTWYCGKSNKINRSETFLSSMVHSWSMSLSARGRHGNYRCTKRSRWQTCL